MQLISWSILWHITWFTMYIILAQWTIMFSLYLTILIFTTHYLHNYKTVAPCGIWQMQVFYFIVCIIFFHYYFIFIAGLDLCCAVLLWHFWNCARINKVFCIHMRMVIRSISGKYLRLHDVRAWCKQWFVSDSTVIYVPVPSLKSETWSSNKLSVLRCSSDISRAEISIYSSKGVWCRVTMLPVASNPCYWEHHTRRWCCGNLGAAWERLLTAASCTCLCITATKIITSDVPSPG